MIETCPDLMKTIKKLKKWRVMAGRVLKKEMLPLV
jgi:hypothetical protein